MTTYIAEPVVPEILKKVLSDNWQNYGGKIPTPEIVEINVPEEQQIRYNFLNRDHIFIRIDPGLGESARPRDTYVYWDFTFNIIIDILTAQSRQRLYDLKQEIRRILIYKMHDLDVNKYQLLLYKGFNELPQEAVKIWKGIVRVSFESAAVYKAVE